MENAQVNTPADLGVELIERQPYGGNGAVRGVFRYVSAWFMTVHGGTLGTFHRS